MGASGSMSSDHLVIMLMVSGSIERQCMICPHCNVAIHDNFSVAVLGRCGSAEEHFPQHWYAHKQECPSCREPIIRLECCIHVGEEQITIEDFIAVPKQIKSRPPAPVAVPTSIATDYNEAILVLDLSAQASAALSRRCLQHVLENTGLSKNSNLNRAIEEAMNKDLPSHIKENLDAVRAIGNFAAHTQKSVRTGEIIPVEPHEAEWNLEVLDMLFDFCYVQPAKNVARRAALDAKLAEADKPSLK